MKITFSPIKYVLATATVTGTLAFAAPQKAAAQNQVPQDTFVKAEIPPEGTTSPSVLACAPSPEVYIKGQKRNAIIVVDEKNNVLYQYDDKGKAISAYSVATGKESTPTHKGVRIVTHIETYPYLEAGRWTKRRKYPDSFGPKIIHLNVLDPETGSRCDNGEYIHGNNNYDSIGKKASHGCMRLDNNVATELSEYVKAGDIVLIK